MPADLVAELLVNAAVTGLTFSGGEPMDQADGLAQLIKLARRERDLTLICFTGYRLARLRAKPPGPGVADLLAETDVLIDGPYIAARNDDTGLPGSNNQRIHHLSDRLIGDDAAIRSGPRRAEIRFSARSAQLVGVPPKAVAQAYRSLPVVSGGAGSEPTRVKQR